MTKKKEAAPTPALEPITEIFGVGIFGGAGMQASIDTALKDEPVMALAITFGQGQHITIGFNEPLLRDLSNKLAGLADILLARVKPDADRTPTAAEVVREGGASYYRAAPA